MATEDSLANNFLIAMPAMDDPNFHKSVSYICEHNKEGAVGLIINRPLTIFLEEVFLQLGIPVTAAGLSTVPVFFGGPVQPERGFVLHRPAGVWRSTMPLDENIHITTSQDILEAIAVGEGPSDAIVVLGYAGWSAEQLEVEMANNVWLNCKASDQILFDTPYSQQWEAAAKLIGVDINAISGDAGHA